MGTEVAATESPVAATVKPTPKAELDAIAHTLIGEKPAVQEHAIAQADAERVASEGRDANGNAFNPAIHATNADGTPRKTARGAYAMKRGRKATGTAESTKPAQSHKGVVIPGGKSEMSATEQEARAAGAGAANLFIAMAVGLMGPEWAPRVDDKAGINEKVMLEQAAGDYFASKGWGDLPPGLALCAAMCMYALPRMTMPQTKSRLQRFKIWIGSKIGAWKAARIGKKRGVPESDVERADRESREMFRRENVEVGAR